MDKETEKKEPPAPIKPLCLALEEAKAEIFAAVNMASKKHNIPFFLLESIVQEAARQASGIANTERENAARTYEKQLTEYQKGEGENERV